MDEKLIQYGMGGGTAIGIFAHQSFKKEVAKEEPKDKVDVKKETGIDSSNSIAKKRIEKKSK